MYSARFHHHPDKFLDICWERAFDFDEVATYAIELKQQFVREGFRPGYGLRIDMRACGPQPLSALEAFRHYFAGFPKARRIAILVADGAAREQVLQEMQQPYLRIFEDEADSLRLVIEGDDDLTLGFTDR